MKPRLVVTASMLLLLLASPAFAQRASVSGVVVDQSEAVLCGVTVRLVNLDRGLRRDAVTDATGAFVLPQLIPGRYSLTIHADGFAPHEIPDLILNVGDELSLTLRLHVANLDETITVPGDVTRSTTVGGVATVVARPFIENLPLSGRGFNPLFELTPGVVLAVTSTRSPGQFSVNGQRTNANYFTIDGVSANVAINAGANVYPGQTGGGSLPALTAAGGTNNLVSTDAVQEFRVQTSSYAPEFGRTPGAQVSIVTRSGTNTLRGSAFEFFRDDALDANDWFANSRGLPQPELRQHDFGAVLGGPLWRNRAFFFGSYEGLRLRQPQARIVAVPSFAAREAADPALRTLFDAFPRPNGAVLADGFSEFSGSFSNPSGLDAVSLRIDHHVSPSFQLFGRYSESPSHTDQRGAFDAYTLSTVGRVSQHLRAATGGATVILSPTLTNEARINWSWSRAATTVTGDDFGGASPLPHSFGLPAGFSRADTVTAAIFGDSGIYLGQTSDNRQRQINIVDVMTWTKGKHFLKFGVDYRSLTPVTGYRTWGSLVFWSSVMEALDGTVPLAVVWSAETAALRMRYTNVSLFGQDTWRITPRLTVTQGVRWEYNPPPTERDRRSPFTVRNLDRPEEMQLGPAGARLYAPTYRNFAPRISAAYLVVDTPGREIVVRGGFGVFYDLGNSNVANGIVGFPYERARVFRGVRYPLEPRIAAYQPFTLDPPYSLMYVTVPDLQLPLTYQWNVTAERSIGPHQAVTLSYVGALGRRLLLFEHIAPTGPFIEGISVTRNGGTSDYHALQAQFQRRLSDGLQALAAYTFAQARDIASSDAFVGAPFGAPLSTSRGPSDFDIRHTVSAAVTYDLDALSALRSTLGRGWGIDAMFRARSAPPVDVTFQGSDRPQDVRVRPDHVAGEPLYVEDSSVPGGRRLNPEAFVAHGEERQGTWPRNALRGFGAWQLDLALRRTIRLTENSRLQLRGEMFNVLNHPNFGNPVGDMDSAFFGRSTGMLGRRLGSGGADGGFSPLYQIGGPRSVQLSLKLLF